MKSAVLVLSIVATLCQGKDLANPHIINGEEAVPHSHPHQVALMRGEAFDTFFCGGSLISENWVLTAAHCVDSGSLKIFVKVGAHNLKVAEESTQKIPVSQIIVHPTWDRNKLVGDIALVKLQGSARLDGKTAQLIRLPKLSDKETPFEKYDATVTGWGRTKTNSYAASPTLQTLTEPVISNAVCKAAFPYIIVRNTHICIKGKSNTSGCHGDSGGPLSLREEDKERTLVGIVSFGSPQCTLLPSVFTRVSQYVDWIHEKTGIPTRN